jgi:hypothetical protein
MLKKKQDIDLFSFPLLPPLPVLFLLHSPALSQKLKVGTDASKQANG